jgi:NAD(P)-dependent dehydrogenase (short-subunit alcohol dehydrogenase family)
MAANEMKIDPREFDGKRAFITGGTKGVGQAIVRRLAAGGATIATTARAPLPGGHAASITGCEYIIDGGTIPTV